MTNTRIFGYADPLNPKAGQSVDFMISVEGRNEVEASLVRLLHGDENPEGPGFIEEEIDIELPHRIEAKRQYTQIGSFARCADPEGRLDGLTSFTMFAHDYPTLLKAERQMIMGRWAIEGNKGYGLGIDPEGRVSLWMGDGEAVDQITTEIPLVPYAWYFIAASFDATTKQATLHVINCVNSWNSRISTVVPFEDDSWVEETLRVVPTATGENADFKLAAATAWNQRRGKYASFLFNGKLDRSGVYDRVVSREEAAALSKGLLDSHISSDFVAELDRPELI